MRRQSRPLSWYEEQALSAAAKTSNMDERRKHLNIAWRTRIALTQRVVPTMVRNLGKCYDEGTEFLEEPAFQESARQLAQVVSNLEALKSTRGNNRLFVLIDESDALPRFTLRHIQTADEARARYPKAHIPFSPFGVSMTDEHAEIEVERTRVIASLGDTGEYITPTHIQIARLPLPWRINTPEATPILQPWVGTLVVGRKAITGWAKSEHEQEYTAIFAARVRGLSDESWPGITPNTSESNSQE